MKIQTHSCDVCSIHRAESNHWWLLTPQHHEGELKPFGVHLIQWELGDSSSEGVIHLCGASCVTKWLSESLL